NSACTAGAHEFKNVTAPSSSPCEASCEGIDCCGRTAPMADSAMTSARKLRLTITTSHRSIAATRKHERSRKREKDRVNISCCRDFSCFRALSGRLRWRLGEQFLDERGDLFFGVRVELAAPRAREPCMDRAHTSITTQDERGRKSIEVHALRHLVVQLI